MFDVVAPHQHKLALPVEIKGIDHAKTRLTRPAAARHVNAPPEGQTENE
jgi:hypothetical protein